MGSVYRRPGIGHLIKRAFNPGAGAAEKEYIRLQPAPDSTHGGGQITPGPQRPYLRAKTLRLKIQACVP
jgi:hypothetical protein